MISLITLSFPIFFISIAVELLINKLRKTNYYRLNDAVANLNSGILSQVVGVFAKVISVGVYIWVYEHCRMFNDIPNKWYTWIALFIGVDFFYYWFHRMTHDVSLFWGSHVVHHQSEDYNLTVALRQSSSQMLVSFWFYLPLAFIGFPPMLFVTIASIQTLYQFWIHTKLINRMPFWFEYIFNTPSHHRVHHGVDPKYIDKNHGGTLIIFDRLFGTFQQEEEEVHYGITSQLNSWNIIIANIDYYGWLLKQVSHVRSLRDFFLVLIKPPGWRPSYLGGPVAAKEVDVHRKLYDADSSAGMHIYIIVQFAILVAFTSFFMFSVGNELNQNGFTIVQKIVAFAFIAYSVLTIGAMFEKKSWVRFAETIRVLLMIPVLLYMLQ
jgi:sterol desaturase/sphingolipid hydroxylase (fatty acid hydroxylase superfamily)